MFLLRLALRDIAGLLRLLLHLQRELGRFMLFKAKAVVMATGGSTNAVLHLLAIAGFAAIKGQNLFGFGWDIDTDFPSRAA